MPHRKKMQWIMFSVFLTLFVIITLATVLALFAGVGHLSDIEKSFLLKTFIGEVSAVIIALFYSLFGMNKSQPTEETVQEVTQEERRPHPFCHSTLYSVIHNEKYIDDNHEYDLFSRQDLIDYDNGQYSSIRELKGKNTSDGDSIYLWHSEATKIPTKFSEIEVVAKDINTGEELFIEYDGDPNESSVIHPFKIYFQRPIHKDQEFHITYFISIKEENKLYQNKDTMSVSLTRLRYVKQVKFNVSLKFKPKSFSAEVFGRNHSRHHLGEDSCKLEENSTNNNICLFQGLPWPDYPYVIKASINEHPILLAINYQA